ncbi:hypothetical protein BDB00DRAFT_854527 [Zychaea mexicana]|uniref:uncharacterized protein n=1 Tax=Zychaea mexicana TaxID=64656 RepID=UPI0022FEA494|nr:uncharacterized protein BDB00DRAFT_854527 [Zychaea mexicana]KAI9484590.1 hypothetical protein BDB00DRAFT_854527 [Zychaea mexicana]
MIQNVVIAMARLPLLRNIIARTHHQGLKTADNLGQTGHNLFPAELLLRRSIMLTKEKKIYLATTITSDSSVKKEHSIIDKKQDQYKTSASAPTPAAPAAATTTATVTETSNPTPEVSKWEQQQKETVIALEADEEEEKAVMEPVLISTTTAAEKNNSHKKNGTLVTTVTTAAMNSAFAEKKGQSLPKPWVAMTSSKGETYYYNSETGDSTWDSPVLAKSKSSRDSDIATNAGNINSSSIKRRRTTPPSSSAAATTASPAAEERQRHRSKERRPVAQNLVHRTDVRKTPPPPPPPAVPSYDRYHRVRYEDQVWMSRRDGLVDRAASSSSSSYRNIRARDPYYNGRDYGRSRGYR